MGCVYSRLQNSSKEIIVFCKQTELSSVDCKLVSYSLRPVFSATIKIYHIVYTMYEHQLSQISKRFINFLYFLANVQTLDPIFKTLNKSNIETFQNKFFFLSTLVYKKEQKMHHIFDTQSTANSFIIHRNCSAMNQTMEFLHFKLVSKQLKRLVQKVLELCTATEYPSLKIMSGIFENLPSHRGAKLPLRQHLGFCAATILRNNSDEFVCNFYLVVSASTVNSQFNKDFKLQVH